VNVAIYSRFSTEAQDATSISGQIANCETLANEHGWNIVARYSDAAISGNDDSRPGYQALLADAESGKFDGILVDETSRLTRRPGELPRLMEELTFRNQWISDCKGFDSRQETAALLAALYGGIDSLELRKIRARTHRSLRERHKAGFSAGGKCYGYTTELVDPDDPNTKKRTVVVPEQAKIVSEIFERYADGESPRCICSDLNRRGVPSPGSTWNRTKRRAKGWANTALVGTAKMYTGILRREQYVGEVVWNRTKWKKVPGTSKRACELRPEAEWIRVSHPDLRIVDDLLWQKTQARLRAARAKSHPNTLAKRGRPSKYLLSGLMICGECGANYIMQDTRAYGCSGHTSGGKHLCSNAMRVKREVAESALLANIKNRLLSDELTTYVEKQFRAAIRDLESREDAPAIELELAGIEQKISKVLDAIESVGVSDSLATRLQKLEAAKTGAEQRLQDALIELEPLDAQPDLVPALVARWCRLAAEIEGVAVNPVVEPGELDTARGHLHALLGQVTLKPKDGVLWAYPNLKPKKPTLKESRPIILVAGAGFEPATFGL
jgi:site-specific DNA recombinase